MLYQIEFLRAILNSKSIKNPPPRGEGLYLPLNQRIREMEDHPLSLNQRE